MVVAVKPREGVVLRFNPATPPSPIPIPVPVAVAGVVVATVRLERGVAFEVGADNPRPRLVLRLVVVVLTGFVVVVTAVG